MLLFEIFCNTVVELKNLHPLSKEQFYCRYANNENGVHHDESF